MRSSAWRAFDMPSQARLRPANMSSWSRSRAVNTPDAWRDCVRARLRPLDVRAERESEIVEELADQLEAAYEAARAEGRTDAEAMDRAHAEVPDWEALA